MSSPLLAFDHVQVAIPPGGEDAARAFYGELLGMMEQPKPEALAQRGGCWFGNLTLKVHCGVEDPFKPNRKAHPAFLVDNVSKLAQRAREAGCEVIEDDGLEGSDRVYINDPFGNRLEFLRPAGADGWEAMQDSGAVQFALLTADLHRSNPYEREQRKTLEFMMFDVVSWWVDAGFSRAQIVEALHGAAASNELKLEGWNGRIGD